MAISEKMALRAGRIVRTLVILALLIDGITKMFPVARITEALTRLGHPPSPSWGGGIVMIACTVLYAIPRTAVLGAILLTGVLGGEIVIDLRDGNSIYPAVIFGIMVWGGLVLRDRRLRTLIPLRH
jgi:hypothetical protein